MEQLEVDLLARRKVARNDLEYIELLQNQVEPEADVAHDLLRSELEEVNVLHVAEAGLRRFVELEQGGVEKFAVRLGFEAEVVVELDDLKRYRDLQHERRAGQKIPEASEQHLILVLSALAVIFNEVLQHQVVDHLPGVPQRVAADEKQRYNRLQLLAELTLRVQARSDQLQDRYFSRDRF